jgi:hypothetical protein
MLDHRWYRPDSAGRDVGMPQSARPCFNTVLPMSPDERGVLLQLEDVELEDRLNPLPTPRMHTGATRTLLAQYSQSSSSSPGIGPNGTSA